MASLNLITSPEDFSAAYWTKLRASVMSDAVLGPDGRALADKFVEDATLTSTHHLYRYLQVYAGQPYTASVFVRAAERADCVIVLNGATLWSGSQPNISYSLVNAAVLSGSATVIASGIKAAGGGWYRIWATDNCILDGALGGLQVRLHDGTTASYTGDSVSGLHLFGAQFEAGPLGPYLGRWFPFELPRPSVEGYELTHQDPHIRTDMEVGTPRVRRRSFAKIDLVTATWTLTDIERAWFKRWFEDDAGGAYGAAWFTVNLAIGSGDVIPVEARFRSMPKSVPLSGLNWRVSADLEIRS